MIITRQWIQEYIDISKIDTDTICKALNSIGLEVDSVQRNIIPNNVVVGKVLEVVKHPDADKLNICQVDIGSKIEQIVCGAKNVAANQLVPVAVVGAVLGENFKIKKAKLRGVESNGMICSSTEIGLPKMNDGILELDNSIGDLKIGKELNEYSLINDDIIEIELTANRGDCLSIHGVARDLSTYFNIPIKKQEFKANTTNKGIGQALDINYNTSCHSDLLYKVASIKEFSLPLIYKLRSAIAGDLKSTDIEIAISYITHSTGVILNVYTKSITNEQNNGLVSLDIDVDEDGFDIVKGKSVLSTIGINLGEIQNLSDEVILEASYINPEFLAQKVFDKKKKTGEIYYRSSRGSEPDLAFGLDMLITLISDCGAKVYNGISEFTNSKEPIIVAVPLTKLNNIIGQDIDKSIITKILLSLGFEVKRNDQDMLTVTVPAFRHDIKNIADVAEEIVRITGIDNIQAKPLHIEEVNRENSVSRAFELQKRLKLKAISNSFYQTVTYVFTSKELLEKYNCTVVDTKKDVMNPIVSELNTLRTTIDINLLNAVSHNIKQGFKSVPLFEIGTIFDKDANESKVMSFIFSGAKESDSIANSGKATDIDFFTFANKISNIIGDFSIEPLENMPNDLVHPYQSGSIVLNGVNIGTIYKVHPTVTKDFDIYDSTFIASVDLGKLQNDIILASSISKFQASRRDISIVAPKSLEYKVIKDAIGSLNIKEIKQFNLIDIYSDQSLGDNESLTIRFILQSDTKTMEESDITKIMDKVIAKLTDDLALSLR